MNHGEQFFPFKKCCSLYLDRLPQARVKDVALNLEELAFNLDLREGDRPL